MLRWGRRHQVHDVNLLYTIEWAYTLRRGRQKCRQIHSVNRPYTMSRLTSYNEEGVIRSTAPITCTQWTDLHTIMRKTPSDPYRQLFLHNAQTYILQWSRRHRIYNVNFSYTMSRLTSYNEEDIVRPTASITRIQMETYQLWWGRRRQIHRVNHSYTMRRLTCCSEEDVRMILCKGGYVLTCVSTCQNPRDIQFRLVKETDRLYQR